MGVNKFKKDLKAYLLGDSFDENMAIKMHMTKSVVYALEMGKVCIRDGDVDGARYWMQLAAALVVFIEDSGIGFDRWQLKVFQQIDL